MSVTTNGTETSRAEAIIVPEVRSLPVGRRNTPYGWSKRVFKGCKITCIEYPKITSMYIQTAECIVDHGKIRGFIAKEMDDHGLTKAPITSTGQMLCVKHGGVYERVRLVEKLRSKPVESAAKSEEDVSVDCSLIEEWRAQLVDNGGYVDVDVKETYTLPPGIGDLPPMVKKCDFNQVRMSPSLSEERLQEGKIWLEETLLNKTLDMDLISGRDPSLVFVDVYDGEKYINADMCEQAAFTTREERRKSAYGGKRRNISASDRDVEKMVGEGGASRRRGYKRNSRSATSPPPSADGGMETSPNATAEAAGDAATKRRSDSHVNRKAGNRRSLLDWAVISCDENSLSEDRLRLLCAMLVSRDRTGRVNNPSHICSEGYTDAAAIEAKIKDIIEVNKRLLLVLCILPNQLEDYSSLEAVGQAEGVVVKCVRGEKVKEVQVDVVSSLRKSLLQAVKESPTVIPSDAVSSRQNNKSLRNSFGGGDRINRSPDYRLAPVTRAAHVGFTVLRKGLKKNDVTLNQLYVDCMEHLTKLRGYQKKDLDHSAFIAVRDYFDVVCKYMELEDGSQCEDSIFECKRSSDVEQDSASALEVVTVGPLIDAVHV